MLLLAILFALAIMVNVCFAIYWWRVSRQLHAERDRVLAQSLRYVETQAQIEQVLSHVEDADRQAEAVLRLAMYSSAYRTQELMH